MLASSTQLITRILREVHLGQPDARERLWDAVYQELHQLAAAHMARESNGRTLQPTALVHEAYLRLIEGGDGAFENRRHFFAAAATAMRRILVDDARRRGRVKRGGAGATKCDADSRRRDDHGDAAACNDALCDDDGGATNDDKRRLIAGATQGEHRPMVGATEDEHRPMVGATSEAADCPRHVARHRRVELADCAAADGPDPADVLAVNEVMAALEREHPLLARVVELRFYGGLSGDQTAEVMEISSRAVDNYWRAARAWLHGKLS